MVRLGLDPVDPMEHARAKAFKQAERAKRHNQLRKEARIRKRIRKLKMQGANKSKKIVIQIEEIHAPEGYTKDHIIPQSFLRKLRTDNIQFLTKEDNLKKGDRLTKAGLEKILKTIIEHL